MSEENIFKVLSAEAQKFISLHENEDEQSILLKYKEIAGVPVSIIADQISGRRKARLKIPAYYNTENILYPLSVNLEQSSSEQTAKFKTQVARSIFQTEEKNKTITDLTGGSGIDSYFFSQAFKNVQYVEPNLSLLHIAKHNYQILKVDNIKHHHSSAEDFIQHSNQDIVFIDPSRRIKNNQKVFLFSECEPNIVNLQSKIFEKSLYLLIKASPLFDIQQSLKELKYIKHIFIVSVNNECKELLLLCEKHFNSEPEIHCINLLSDRSTDSFSFLFSEERNLIIDYINPLNFVYEPNASILKAGAFKTITKQFPVQKIHPSTHLYTSDVLINNFPGRIFKIESKVKAEANIIQHYFPEGKANVTTRNYPLSVSELKKKTKLKDGGEKFLIGFSGLKEKFLVAAARIK